MDSKITLIGQYDSPFVRRAAIALHHHAVPFDRLVTSVFQNFDAVLEINPLGKVPTLLIDDGQPIFDSRAIIEYIDSVGSQRLTLAATDPGAFINMLRLEAIGIGLAEKTYERGLEFSRKQPVTRDGAWIERLERQIASALAWLEQHAVETFLVESRLTRADLAVATATTYILKKLPQLFVIDEHPKLESHRQFCEALPAFAAAPYSNAEAIATGWTPE